MQLVELCLNNPNADKKIRDFNKSAVRFLIKELKASPKLLKELERAISEKCSDSKCITIPAKTERRLLVAHRRCKPQVVYCRLWRWPDLQSHHQIKSICQTKRLASGSGAICINPYHYERNIPKQIDPILVPLSKIPPDLSSSVEDSGPREERTKSWPAKVSFIQHLEPYLYKQNQPEQAEQNSGMRTTDSVPLRIATGHTMISTDELHVDQVAQIYNGTYTEASGQHSVNSISEINSPPITTPQQQQYLQTQTNLHAAPYQFQVGDQSGRSQGRHFQKQQQPSHMSLLQQSQYQANMSQGGIGPSTSQPKPLTTRADVNRPFRFRAKGFAGRVDQEQTNVCRDPRYNGYTGNPYPCGSQRMSTQVAFSQPGPTQRPGMAVSTMANSNLSPQLMCSPSNTSFGSTSTVTAQQALHAQILTPDYPTIFSPHQQYSAQEQTMQLGYPTDSTMSVAEQPSSFECYTATEANHDQNAGGDHQMDHASAIDVQEIPFIDDKYWCSITYHEYDQRIGEKYHSCSPIVSVDGFTQPMCNDRFCIGGISNVNRNQFTEWVRRRIGRGVKLTYLDGDVYVEGISESSVFVSNPLHDADSQKGAPDDLVVKLSPGCSARAFSTHEFGKLLHAAVSEGFEAVYKLTSKCVIKISFVKGWGKNYKRQSIYNTPCWVEVQLNGPLQWIDKVLRQMRPPTGCCSTS